MAMCVVVKGKLRDKLVSGLKWISVCVGWMWEGVMHARGG